MTMIGRLRQLQREFMTASGIVPTRAVLSLRDFDALVHEFPTEQIACRKVLGMEIECGHHVTYVCGEPRIRIP